MALGTIGGITYADQAKASYVAPITPDKMKWNPADAKNPKGLQVAVLAGDPMKGPVALEIKLPKGPAPIHWHSSDYYAVIMDGKTKHWLPNEDGAKAPINGVGTFWFQPGGSDKTAHGDECMTDTCTIFLMMPGKFDMTVVKK
jgi:hypothetical protein